MHGPHGPYTTARSTDGLARSEAAEARCALLDALLAELAHARSYGACVLCSMRAALALPKLRRVTPPASACSGAMHTS